MAVEVGCKNALYGIAGARCPVCEGVGRPLGEVGGCAVRECRNGHAPVLLSWQWSSVAEYEATYSETSDYHTAMQQAEGQAPSWERDTEHMGAALARLRQLQLFVPSGRLLDIGAGTGAFVAMAQAYGYKAQGIEPTEMAYRARTLGRDVQCGVWHEMEGRWDVITMHDVWEHLTNPVMALDWMMLHLRPGGMAVIEIPEWGGPQARRWLLNWKHIRPMQHLFLPSDGAAREMFESGGYCVEAAIRPQRGELGKIAYYLSDGNGTG